MEGHNGSVLISASKRWEDISSRAIERLSLAALPAPECLPEQQEDAALSSGTGSAQLSASTQSVQQLVCRFNAQSKPAAIVSFPNAALLESQLDLLGVTTSQLSETGRQHLHVIAGVADRLGLASAEPAAVLGAVARLRQQHWSAEDSQAAAGVLSSQLREQIAIVRHHAEELSAASLTLGQQREAAQAGLELKEERMLRMQQKAVQYAAELEQLDKQLERDGFVPELQHSRLMERATKLSAKQAHNAALQKRLGFFMDLPPDMEAARQVYAQKYELMQTATKQFEEGLAQL